MPNGLYRLDPPSPNLTYQASRLGRSEIRSRQKVGCSNIQRIGESVDVVEAYVAFATLDTSDVGPVEVCLVGERLLTESSLVAESAEPIAKRDSSMLALCWC